MFPKALVPGLFRSCVKRVFLANVPSSDPQIIVKKTIIVRRSPNQFGPWRYAQNRSGFDEGVTSLPIRSLTSRQVIPFRKGGVGRIVARAHNETTRRIIRAGMANLRTRRKYSAHITLYPYLNSNSSI